jgi:diacylglycerol kinase family enzyme
VARSVLNTSVILGIIPTGSGNGLARSLGISLDTKEALNQILENKTGLIDSGTVNNIPFFCTSGIGFDAHIGKLFATATKRGLQSYVKMILGEFLAYKPQAYTLQINGKEISKTAFLITVANAGQYGNDFYIAPQAKLNDGLFHVVILKPFNFLQGIGIVLKVMRRKAHHSKFIETFACDQLSIKREKSDSIHYDGEPESLGIDLNYINHSRSLKVIVGDTFDRD